MPVADEITADFAATKSESRNPVEIGFARIKPRMLYPANRNVRLDDGNERQVPLQRDA
jgi:hypothetical protein